VRDWPLGLLKVSRIIDNPSSVAKARSEKAGEVLADALINKAQGESRVTLIGYSRGARVIYTCLMTLTERRAFGLVESVVLVGAPTPSTASEWRKVRSVVSGRVVNVYSTNNYIPASLHRTSSIQYGAASLQKVEGVKEVEGIDVSGLVSGHTRYRYLAGSILKKIGFEDIDMEEVARKEAELKAVVRGLGKEGEG
jgi:pimeloyl-ACP methyl ester carboxylesterase